MDIYNAQKDRIANPLAIEDIDVSLDGYAAIYLPGGHGAMLGLVSFHVGPQSTFSIHPQLVYGLVFRRRVTGGSGDTLSFLCFAL